MPVESLDDWLVERSSTGQLQINVWISKEKRISGLLKAFSTGKSNGVYVEHVIPAKKIVKCNIGSSASCWKCEKSNNLVLLLPFDRRKQNPNFHIQTFEEIESVCRKRVSFSSASE
jgi:hypothetical protein